VLRHDRPFSFILGRYRSRALLACFWPMLAASVALTPVKSPAQTTAAYSQELHAQGRAMYAQRNYSEAVAIFQKGAALGDASAQYLLGKSYFNGQGIKQDQAQAAALWRRAADQGYVPAQFLLAYSYHRGTGVPRDYAQALALYRKVAAQDVLMAQAMLGQMYLKGEGVKPDDKVAFEWFQRAANQTGFPRDFDPVADADGIRSIKSVASYTVALMYEGGFGVPQDASLAKNWFARAAELGHADAKTKLLSLREGPSVTAGLIEFVCQMGRGQSHVTVDAALKSVKIEGGPAQEFKDSSQQYVTVTAKAIEFGCRARKADTDVVADSLSNMFQPTKSDHPLQGLNNDILCLTRHRIDRTTGLWTSSANGALIGNVSETADCKPLPRG
jgi:TPR repeat protein